MSPGKNIILKTVFDLHYNGGHDGIALQQVVGEWCRNELAKALGEQLDRLDTPGIVVKIDSLAIDVNINDHQNWLHALLPEITRQLADKSSDAVQKQVGMQQNFLQSFFHFLEHGSLPWWSIVQKQQELVDGLAQIDFDAKEKNEFSKLLYHSQVKERVALLPDIIFLKLLRNVVPKIEKIWRDLERNGLIPESDTAETGLRKAMKESILDHVYDANLEMHAENILTTFRQRSEKLGRVADAVRNAQTNLRSSQKPSVYQSSTDNNAIKDQTEVVDYTDGLYIRNAGLIIVAPFLPALFTKLKLLNNSTITDIDKAVCIVHFLASGTDVLGELELGLAKVLCGVEMKAVIDTSAVVDDFCKEEANNLLLSVVEHWSILKDTSVSGLQESFLQRDGKLIYKDNEWNLHVEQRPYDMVLQNLPWNISMIKLSWMPHLLRAEWVF